MLISEGLKTLFLGRLKPTLRAEISIVKADQPRDDGDMEELEKTKKAKTFWGKALWISGVGIVLPPMIGLTGTVIGMVRAFGTLQAQGEADPSELAGSISLALYTTLFGMGFSVIALIAFVISLVLFMKHRRNIELLAAN